MLSRYWIPFLVGLAMHVLLQAWSSVRASSNGVATVLGWLKIMWVPVLGRAFLCAVGMTFWLESPALFSKGLTLVAINFAIPMNYGTSALFGYTVDSLLDKVAAILGGKFNVDLPTVVPPKP